MHALFLSTLTYSGLSFGVLSAFGSPEMLRYGIPLLLLLLNAALAPVLMKNADRVEWNPEDHPLSEDLCGFIFTVLQAHHPMPGAEASLLLGAKKTLPLALGLVREDAPAIMIQRSPEGRPGLVVSTGFCAQLDEEAQKAAVAHELYFLVKHERSAFSTALMALPSVLFTAYQVVGRSGSGKGGQVLGGLLYAAYRGSTVLTAWHQRKRIFSADAFAVSMTGSPQALADAILTMSFGLARAARDPDARTSPAFSPFNLADPEQSVELAAEAEALGGPSRDNTIRALRWERANLASRVHEWFSFHPLPSRRLDRLVAEGRKLGHDLSYGEDEPLATTGYAACVAEVLSRWGSWIGAFAGWTLGGVYDFPPNQPLWAVCGLALGVLVQGVLWYWPLAPFHPSSTGEALEHLEVSEAWPLKVAIDGRIGGRERPGYAFDSDLVLQDGQGQVVLRYKQPVPLLDTAFAYFAADELTGRPARVEGWFRRGPFPYIEVRRLVLLDDGRVYGCYRWTLQWLGFAASLALVALVHHLI